jgi:hypothetical protein
MHAFPDLYTIRARVLPASLAGLPLGLVAFPWITTALDTLSSLGITAAMTLGLTLVMAQIGRDAGKRREQDLYRQWGGAPTTRLLRHREANNDLMVERRGGQLAALTGLHIPSPAEEAADLPAADAVYEACVVYLRESTRDRKKFPLVFEENCSYGFRRNTWGLKPYAVTISIAVLLGAIAHVAFSWQHGVPALGIAVAFAASLSLAFWIFGVTAEWVRLAAEAYAERLLGTCELLAAERGRSVPAGQVGLHGDVAEGGS